MTLLPLFLVTLMAAAHAAPKQMGQNAVKYNQATMTLLHELENLKIKSLLKDTQKKPLTTLTTADAETGLKELEAIVKKLDLNRVVVKNMNLKSRLEEVQKKSLSTADFEEVLRELISWLEALVTAMDADNTTNYPDPTGNPYHTGCLAPGVLCNSNNYHTPCTYLCDGIDDCGDNSDEQGCTETQCLVGHSSWCNNTKTCLPEWLVCDGEDNCGDMSDEQGCEDNHTGDPDHTCNVDGTEYPDHLRFPDNTGSGFLCHSNNHCIPGAWVCNGMHDCEDDSDEQGCGDNHTGYPDFGYADHTCNVDATEYPDIGNPDHPESFGPGFLCYSNNQCIPGILVCNGKGDCGDNSDEYEQGCEDGIGYKKKATLIERLLKKIMHK